jgi:hypothetical protein
MELPERLGPLLDELRSFCASAQCAAFRAESRERFFGADDVDPEEEAEFDDYLHFAHRDASGRSAVDLFLESRAGDLDPQRRDAYRALERSEFGFFRVTEVRPGEGVELRRAGTADAELIPVVDVAASQTLEAGSALFARVVPYRDHREFGTALLAYPPEAAYNLERTIARVGPAALDELSDPLKVRDLLRHVRRKPQRRTAENRLEAELLAEEAFASFGLSTSVAEVQERFQTMERPLDILKELRIENLEDRDQFQQFLDALMGLWNHTPRQELGGLTPAQKHDELRALGVPDLPPHLAEDFLATAAAAFRPDAHPDDSSRRQALERAYEDWLRTPQAELEDRAPADVLEEGDLQSLPPELELPPADVPMWSVEALAELLRAGVERPRAAAWALGYLCAHKQSEEVESVLADSLVLPLLHHEDAKVVERALDALAEAPQGVRERFCPAILALLDELPASRVAAVSSALELLRATASSVPVEVFGRFLRHEVSLVQCVAARALEESGLREAAGILVDRLREPCEPLAFASITGALLRVGNPEEIRCGFESLVDESVEPASLFQYLDALAARFGGGHSLWEAVDFAFFPGFDREEPGVASGARVFRPVSDPQAASRAAAIFPERRQRELFDLLDRRRLNRAAKVLGELTREALERAREENPGFARHAEALAALVEALQARPLGSLPPNEQEKLLVLTGAVFAWALRGRDVDREWKEEGGDPAKALSFLRLDADWLDRARIERLAALVSERDLAALAKSGDRHVASNAFAVLAAQDPGRYLVEALEHAPHYGAAEAIVSAAAGRKGDAILAPLVDWARKHWDEDYDEVFADALAALGTLRAREVASRSFDAVFARPARRWGASLLISAVLDLGDLRLAERALELLRGGSIHLRLEATRPADREELVDDVAAIIELLGRAEDAAELVEAGIRRFQELTAEEEPEDEEEVDVGADFEDVVDEDRLGAYARTFDEVTTIHREAPKVGRNEPCPCGSGKKYKKCCGKG